VSVTGSNGCYVYTYDSNDTPLRGYFAENGNNTISTADHGTLDYIRVTFSSGVTAVTITNTTTGQILIKYEA